MNVVLIGSGNVAHVLGRLISSRHKMLQVYSPTPQHAAALAGQLNCPFTYSVSEIDATADLYVLAIADKALPQFVQQWQGAAGLVVHTAGSLPIGILAGLSAKTGVLYPLQSLRKERDTYQNIPLLIEANDAEGLQVLSSFAYTLSQVVHEADSLYRQKLHVAAVVVSAFSNYLYMQAQRYCTAENLDSNLLLPLMIETADRLYTHTAAAMQTGPAARGDMETIASHLALLQNHPELAALYTQFTNLILRHNGRESIAEPH